MVKKRGDKTVLIIGSGGREHALGWKLAQSAHVDKIYFAPGTIGTETIGESTNIPLSEIETLAKFAREKHIDLTVAGPDDALAAGLVNAFQKQGLKIFGPTKEAAQIESSKAFAKQVMQDAKIPTAKYKTFTNITAAKKYLANQTFPLVIKASGLALGKGVVIASTKEEAESALTDMLVKKVFGTAGEEVIIEEYLQGPEISIHAFSDGKTVSLFPAARDHKTIFAGNTGPNTGGMGTIAPLPDVSEKELEQIKKTIVLPLIKTLSKQGSPFVGCIYPGLMMTKDGPKVLEFNARFGDPETESYMRLLKTDLFEILTSCVEGTLAKQSISWKKQAACCIVLASAGYPAGSHKGDIIHGLKGTAPLTRGGLEGFKDVVVFHFATKKLDGKIVTNGGRVLGITAIGKTLNEALSKAYHVIGATGIHFAGMQYRKDIGQSTKMTLQKKT